MLRAYEHDPLLPYPALLVLGPFMQAERQAEFMDRAAKLKRVDAITFHGQLEALVARAPAWWRWAATTPSARSCRSTSAR